MSENQSNLDYEQYLKQNQAIGSKIDLEAALDKGVNVSEMFNVPLRVQSIELRTGANSEYIKIHATDLRSNEGVTLRTGAQIIMSILRSVHEANQFPVDLAFHQAPDGKTKLIRDIVPEDFNDDIPF